MRFRLWGTRGSLPSPLRTEEIEDKLFSALSAAAKADVDLSNPVAVRAFVASLPHPIRGTAGGDTACIEVRSGGNLFIFDCGSGLRRLGMDLMNEEFGRGQGVAHVFITHTHWDHLMGWPFFGPVYIPGNKFFVYGVHPDLEARFRLQQTAPSMFPQPFDFLASDIRFVTLQEGGTIEIGSTRISNISNYHLGESYGYRIEDDDGVLVLSTDNEYKTFAPGEIEQYVDFYRDADALIFDAMFSWKDAFLFEDWGHSSAVAGVDLATRAGVRRLLLFHHAPRSNDSEIWKLRDYAEEYLEQQPDRPHCEIIVAYDGLEIELWREATLKTDFERRDDGNVVHLSGRLVQETAPAALDAFREATDKKNGRPLVLDLSDVTLISNAGLAALFEARRRWRPVALASPSPELQRSLTSAGAPDYFVIYDTADHAFSALDAGLSLRPGQYLNGRYKIEELLDRGLLGDLYRASDESARREVAITVICPSIGHTPSAMMMNASRTATRLRHPSIADVYEVGQADQLKFIVTEYTPGRSVRELLAASRAESTRNNSSASRWTAAGTAPAALPATLAVQVALQVSQALQYAHRRNIVHGGLKPDSIILLDDGSIKVISFGAGRIEIDRPLIELPAHMGRLENLAPEQIQGHGNSRASDLYALGTVLYEMLTGEPPYDADDAYEDFIGLQLRQAPVPPRRRNPNISRSLEYLVLNLLQKSPHQRPSKASVVSRTLTNLTAQLRQRPLVGRDSECEKLQHHLERVVQGQSGLLVVHGRKGVGKSRLVLSAASQWQATQRLTVVYGELYPFEDERPYQLFVETLRRSLLTLPAHALSQLLRDLGGLADPLTTLIPQLQPALSAIRRPDKNCERLEEAVCETLRLMTEEDPVLLVLDGLQWIDEASLRLLNRLVRQRVPRLLIVAIFRSQEADLNHPLREVLNDLDSWIDDQLQVQPLGPMEVHQLTSTIDAQVPSDFGLWLYSTTNGNPLHIEQLVQAFLDGPTETRHPLERARDMTLEDAVVRRLERLPDGVLGCLRQAAVLGQTFEFETLQAALDVPDVQVLAHLDTALQANIIVGHPAEDRYHFNHPVIREVIYADMLGGVRRRYHWRAAHVLERAGAVGKLDERIDQLAHHFAHAGEHEKAVAYLARATRRSRELCAYEAALNYVSQALAMVEQLDRTATSQREREQRGKQRADLLAARADLEAVLER
jgi:anti-anti-sigma factor